MAPTFKNVLHFEIKMKKIELNSAEIGEVLIFNGTAPGMAAQEQQTSGKVSYRGEKFEFNGTLYCIHVRSLATPNETLEQLQKGADRTRKQ